MPAPAAPPPTAPAPAPAAPAPPSPAPGGPTIVPAAPLTARQRLTKAMFDKATPAPAPSPAPAPPKPEATPPKPGEPEPPKGGEPTPAPEPKPGEGEGTPPAPDPGGKKSPWKLVEQYKSRVTALESENLELKSRVTPENDAKAIQERIKTLETRNKEYEDEMRNINYQKSEEFRTKFQQPWESAWRRAMKEVAGIHITDGDEKRAVTANDILSLVNLDLGPARELADAAFGPFSDDVMRLRNELRSLADTQMEAIEEYKKNGATQEDQRRAASAQAQKLVNDEIAKTWKDVNEAVAKDPELSQWFSAKEGDDDWNTRLEKGYALVDKAFSENPQDPKLTPEQRREIIKRHTALRNRAAGWAPLRNAYKKTLAKIAALEKELSQYKSSEPGAGNGQPGAPGSAAPVGSAKDRIHAAFAAKAK